MTDIMKEIELHKARIDALQLELRAKSKEAFKEISENLFERYTKLESFSWIQYTPYFNDGEPCEFAVYADADSVSINGSERYDIPEWWDEFNNDGYEQKEVTYNYGSGTPRSYMTNDLTKPINKRPNPAYEPELVAASEAITKLISALDEEALKQMFGDHASIIVTREGVEVEEYSHD